MDQKPFQKADITLIDSGYWMECKKDGATVIEATTVESVVQALRELDSSIDMKTNATGFKMMIRRAFPALKERLK